LTHFFKLFFAALIGVLVLNHPVLAQQAPPAEGKTGEQKKLVPVHIPIGVLDVQAILREASAVKDIRGQITKYGTDFEKEIEKERNELRKANQELARQRTILAPEAFAEKRREFEQRVVEVQRLVQQRQRDLDKSRNVAMGAVNKAYIEVVAKLADDRNLAIIVRKSQTAYSVGSLDLTKAVLDLLNTNLPKVKVAQPGK
jgi:Skp family chaperone for outer membrane proteins|tara:strand:+ start:159 stop:758 length:600 start_codon:yes stop_codon:yes gene_type:complete